jgi:o-succinylbenzoate synthase
VNVRHVSQSWICPAATTRVLHQQNDYDKLMAITQATLHPYRLRLKRPWITASGRIDWRQGWLLAIRDSAGITGWGDCAPLPEAGSESHQKGADSLAQFIRHLPGGEPDLFIGQQNDLPPAARCAVETAVMDLQARRRGISFTEQLGARRQSCIGVNAACGDLLGGGQACADQAIASGFRIIKFKVGVADPAREIAMLEAVARECGGKIAFRLDANGAWNLQQAIEFIGQLQGLNIESLEEPLMRSELDQFDQLQERCDFPLALDESLAHLDPAAALALTGARRWVLKPTVLGGPLAVMGWAGVAADAGIEVVVTSSLESVIGVAMCAQLAAALPPGPVHGLATGGWYVEDVAPVLEIDRGSLLLPQGPGLGRTPDACWLANQG